MHPTVILSIKKYTKSTTKYKISQKQNKSRILFCVGQVLLRMRPALKGICYIQFHSTEENDSPCPRNSQFQIGGDSVHTFLSVCWDLCLDWAWPCSMHDVSLWEFGVGQSCSAWKMLFLWNHLPLLAPLSFCLLFWIYPWASREEYGG